MHRRVQAVLDLGRMLGGSPPASVVDRLRRGGDAFAEVVAAAVRHRLCGALYQSMARRGAATPLPDFLRHRLGADHPAVVLEGGRLREEAQMRRLLDWTRVVVSALNAAGVQPMPLKGLAMVLDGTQSEPGRRWMCDIDLLIREEDMGTALGVLAALGAVPGHDHGASHHLPPMVLPDRTEVELHRALVVPELEPALPVARVWRDAVPFETEGLRLMLPSPADAILHNALHAQESKLNYRTCRLPLRRLADVPALMEAHAWRVNWDRLAERAAAANFREAFECHLHQAARLFGLQWPLSRPPSGRVRLHWAVCRLALAYPDPVEGLLYGLRETRESYAKACAGRSALGRLGACAELSLGLMRKYRGGAWGRLTRGR